MKQRNQQESGCTCSNEWKIRQNDVERIIGALNRIADQLSVQNNRAAAQTALPVAEIRSSPELSQETLKSMKPWLRKQMAKFMKERDRKAKHTRRDMKLVKAILTDVCHDMGFALRGKGRFTVGTTAEPMLTIHDLELSAVIAAITEALDEVTVDGKSVGEMFLYRLKDRLDEGRMEMKKQADGECRDEDSEDDCSGCDNVTDNPDE